MPIPLEDNFTDIIGKAQRGLGISDSQLAEESGASADAIRQLHDGKFDRATSDRIAPVLQLNSAALAGLAEGKFQPDEIQLDGLAQFNTPYHDMQVNAYLVWDPASKEAVAFDSGANCSAMLEHAKKHGLTIKFILLTHAHPDHVADLERLARRDRRADLPLEPRKSIRRTTDRRGNEVHRRQTRNRVAPDLGTFSGRHDLCRERTGATGRDRGRLALCRLDGRRQCFLRGCIAEQPGKNSHSA